MSCGRRFRGERFDVVHAHFGLTAWPARAVPARGRVVTLHGTDLEHPRSRAITLAGLRSSDIVGVVSRALARAVPRWACSPRLSRSCPAASTSAASPGSTAREARARLGLDPDGRYLLFPADPARPEKRFDRAQALVDGLDDAPTLLTLGDVDPAEVPLWVNAANAVLVPSEREGFGLAVLEALACDVPVLATPVGVAPEALPGVAGRAVRAVRRGRLARRAAAASRRRRPAAARRPRPRRAVLQRHLRAQVLDAWTELLDQRGW